MGIVVGSVVDGVPESAILGIQVGVGLTISLRFVVAVFVSNIPQAIAPSADLAASGWGAKRLGRLWFLSFSFAGSRRLSASLESKCGRASFALLSQAQADSSLDLVELPLEFRDRVSRLGQLLQDRLGVPLSLCAVRLRGLRSPTVDDGARDPGGEECDK